MSAHEDAAALVAADQPIERALDVARRAFSTNPTGDFNWLPLMSLIKGRRVRTAIDSALHELVGEPVAVEDLWKTYFCVATNYSQASEHRIDRGDLGKALLASIAIPGALPPVVREGDLLQLELFPASYEFDGYWLDIGRPDDYDRANEAFGGLRGLLLPEPVKQEIA